MIVPPTQITAGPDPAEPRPGGMVRFLIAAAITVAVLVGTVWGMLLWMAATSNPDYKGPQKLQYPEHRPFR